ncbi:MAG: cell wall-active antibiotics response protein LiaF [Planifilum sp.]|jgi:lia operon protein LiaF
MMRRLRNQVAGFALLFIGFSIVVGLIDFGHFLLGPLFLFGMGYILYQHVHRWIGYMLFGLAAIAFFHGVLGIDVFGFLLSAFFLYVGYCLLTDKPVPFLERFRDPIHRWFRRLSRRDPSFGEFSSSFRAEGMSQDEGAGSLRSSLVGNVRMEGPFELEDVQLSHAVCDTTIDLSKAVIPDGESTLVISSLIGDVDIYVPYDMPVSVGATAVMGDLKILDRRHSGFGCRVHTETPGYRQSSRRVKITVSLLIGDVDVRVL